MKNSTGPRRGRPPKVVGGLGPMRGFRAPDALIKDLDRIAKAYGVERSDLIREVLTAFANEWKKSRKTSK